MTAQSDIALVLDRGSLKLIERSEGVDEEAFEVAYPIEGVDESPIGRSSGSRRKGGRADKSSRGGGRAAAAEPRPTGTVERFEDENDEVDSAAGMESQAPRMERFDDDDDDDEVAPQMDAASPTPAGDGLNDEE